MILSKKERRRLRWRKAMEDLEKAVGGVAIAIALTALIVCFN